DHVGWNILTNCAAAPHHAVGANMDKLMKGGLAAQNGPIVYMNVAGQLHTVGDNGVRADLTVVRDMDVGHDPVVITHASDPNILCGACIQRDEFPEHVAVTYF